MGGLNAAAIALGFPTVQALQTAVGPGRTERARHSIGQKETSLNTDSTKKAPSEAGCLRARRDQVGGA